MFMEFTSLDLLQDTRLNDVLGLYNFRFVFYSVVLNAL